MQKTFPHLLGLKNCVKFPLIHGRVAFFYPLLRMGSGFVGAIGACNGNKSFCFVQYGAHRCQKYEWRRRRAGQCSILQLYLGRRHTWARGGGGGVHPPLRVKTKTPPFWQKNGYPLQKVHGLFYPLYPLFLAFFIVHVSFSNQTE